MDVRTALESRHSVRSFQQDPVDRQMLLSLMDAALHSPSWANTQPWEVYVAGGEPLERIRQEFAQWLQQGVERHSDVPRPDSWPPQLLERMEELRAARMEQIEAELAKQPRPEDESMTNLNRLFFRAPAVIYVCMERALTAWSIFDIGMLAQSIMLEATAQGLGTIPAYNLVVYPDILRRELEIPEDLSIVIGIAIGYEEAGHPQNAFRSPRRQLNETVRFRGV